MWLPSLMYLDTRFVSMGIFKTACKNNLHTLQELIQKYYDIHITNTSSNSSLCHIKHAEKNKHVYYQRRWSHFNHNHNILYNQNHTSEYHNCNFTNANKCVSVFEFHDFLSLCVMKQKFMVFLIAKEH
jgi:hypothetical protein